MSACFSAKKSVSKSLNTNGKRRSNDMHNSNLSKNARLDDHMVKILIKIEDSSKDISKVNSFKLF